MLSHVGYAPFIPDELKSRPFTIGDARRLGVSSTALRGKPWKRIGRELYCWVAWEIDPWKVFEAWANLLPRTAVFAGDSAAWMHGLDSAPLDPVEVVVPPDCGVRSRLGLAVRTRALELSDVVPIRSLRATSLHRTPLDACSHKEDGEALVTLDMAVRTGRTDAVAMSRYARCTNAAGANRMRRLSGFVEPAESPMETRLRWLYITHRLPRPQVQVELRNQRGLLIARADLYYPSHRLVIEFDGGYHKERLVEDNRRQNLLIDAGYKVLRFTTSDLRDRPDVVVALTRAALAEDETHFSRQNGVKNAAKQPFVEKVV